jgi:acyl transferase domain-containing protein/acyl carrier protein
MDDFYKRIKQLSPKQLQLLAMDLHSQLLQADAVRKEPVAIVGLACRFPGGANSPAEFWQLLRNGVDAITEVPPDRWNIDEFYDPDPDAPGKMATRWGGFLDDPALFDAEFFGIAPREAASMDPQQRLLLEVVWHALEDAVQAPDSLKGTKSGVFLGMSSGDYFQMMMEDDPGRFDAYLATGNSNSVGSGRIAYVLGLHGPALTVDTACSSSLVAVHLACQSLLAGECSLAIAGGVNRILSPKATITLSRARMMSPDGRCKTFDASANGFVRAEGCGVVVLKRLSDAVADGDAIRAVIRGSAVNQDGKSNGLTAPSGIAQQAVIADALKAAGVSAAAIDYVETHGTGTSLGDPIEVEALGTVLGKHRPADRPVMLGALKSNIGHMEAAAGVGGLIKAVLCLEHGEIPPLLHLRALNPHIAWGDLPLKPVTELTAWPGRSAERLAGVSSFGFSGTNAHLIVADAPPATAREGMKRPLHLLHLSAQGAAPLGKLATAYGTLLRHHPEGDPADVCYSTGAGRARFSHNLVVVGSSNGELAGKLARFLDGDASSGVRVQQTAAADLRGPVFMFSGQGSQYAGMGQALYGSQPVFRDAFNRCSTLLDQYLDRSLIDVLYGPSGSQALLDETAYTQPAIFALQYALAGLWKSWGTEASIMIGHSIGEVAAACLAGVFSLEDACKLIAVRGRLSQNLPEQGSMAAILAPEDRVSAVVRSFTGVTIAALNGPANTVVSGRMDEVRQVCRMLESEGIESRQLPVSQAFHSPLVEPMLDEFRKVAESVTYQPPGIPVMSTVTGELVRDDMATPQYWVQHVRRPVRFLQVVRQLEKQGYRLFLELGPHTTLCGMGAACVADGYGIWMPSLHAKQGDWNRILTSLGDLVLHGCKVNWSGFEQGYGSRKVRLPNYPFDRRHHWLVSSRTAASGSAGEKAGTALLGTRIDTALGDRIFEFDVTLDAFPYLNDHRVFGACVVPAPFFLSMLHAAAANIGLDGPVSIAEVQLSEALTLPVSGGRRLQLTLSPAEDDGYRFHIHSRNTGERLEHSSWTQHVSGAIRLAEAAATQTKTPQALVAGLGDEHAGDAHYDRVQRAGVEFGPAFRGVKRFWCKDGEAVAEVSLPPALRKRNEHHGICPPLLDCCLHAIGAALPHSDEDFVWLVTAIHDCRIAWPLPETLWCQARLDRPEATAHSLNCDVRLFDSHGKPAGQLTGVGLKRLNRAALLPGDDGGVGRWLYEVQWQRRPNFELRAGLSADVTSPKEIAKRVEPFCATLGAEFDFAGYADLIGELETLAVAYVLKAMRRLDVEFRAGARMRTGELADRLHIVRNHRRLFGRWLEMLEEDRILEERDDSYVVLRDPDEQDVDRLRALLAGRYTAFTAEIEFLDRCAQPLDEIVTGRQDPLELLFPGGSLAEVTKLTQDSPAARVFNTLVQTSVKEIVARWPADRPLRILEIGAGTGGTTSSLLPVLRDRAAEYVFTDVSPLFLAEAESRFRDYDFIRYELLDIERDPAEQGFRQRGFDVVVAANVLHATRDMNESVANVARLLGDNGVLLLLEGTGPQRWVDLTFGLTEGWWRFTDTTLRPSHPLLTRALWSEVLAANGFEDTSFLPSAPARGSVAHQAVVVSRRAAARKDPAHYVLFGATPVLAGHLADELAARGDACTIASHGAAYERHDGGRVSLDLFDEAHSDRLLREALDNAADLPVRVVHLAGSGAPFAAAGDSASLDECVMASCRSALALAKAASRQEAGSRLRIWFVTGGAVNAPGTPSGLRLPQVPLWGMARTFAVEHPELWGALVDLDVALADPAKPLLNEISSSDGEDQVAFRDGERYVARLVNREPQEPRKSTALNADATYLVTGAFGGMGKRVTRWLAEQGARHLALVGRSGSAGDSERLVEELRARGIHVEAVRGDVADVADMSTLFDSIDRTMPPLKGVMHIAGIYDDRVLARQDWQRFRRVLGPKVAGAWNLHRHTEHRELDFFVLFASGASFLGPAGLGNYAAGNAFLDALAEHRKAAGLPAVSIDWGPWENIGMAEAVGEVRQDQWTQAGFATMTAAQGLDIMRHLMYGDAPSIGVLDVDWGQYLERFGRTPPLYSQLAARKRSGAVPSSHSGATSRLQQLLTAPEEERLELLTNLVKETVMMVLGYDSAQPMDEDHGFFDLGMDSLTALELKNRLQVSLEHALPSTLAFDHSSVNALAEFLFNEVLEIPAADNDDDTVNDDTSTGLSEEDVAELLEEKLRSLTGAA